ncbi:hypothetical protein SDC9_98950 [bioreactor metagenome]|uniref:Uncharacterized protein n=1 Tax=bioreactor metagenome TaxID=1076179 RepID=A0A645ARH2_9ZZZZ
MDGADWIGVTYAGYQNPSNDQEEEPGAACPVERLWTIDLARMIGAKTWVSMEPIVYAPDALSQLKTIMPDRVMIGKMNHRRSAIDWKDFGRRAEAICIQRGLNYYIKSSLRAEME